MRISFENWNRICMAMDEFLMAVANTHIMYDAILQPNYRNISPDSCNKCK